MKITSLDRNIKEVLSSGYFKIPRFQRPFSWEREQIAEFWEDLISDEESDYFIGSMVVYKEKDDLHGVVDGQQRLTTITMILCALRNAFAKLNNDNLARGIHELVERLNIDNNREYVLQTETSYPYLQEHIQKYGSPETKIGSKDEERLLRNAFGIISANIEEIISLVHRDPSVSEENKIRQIEGKLVRIRTKVLGLKVIYITLDNEDDAYEIFETLNTRGKNLDASDLLKSYIVKLIKPTNVNVDLPKEKWAEIIETVNAQNVKVDEFLGCSAGLWGSWDDGKLGG